MQPNWGLSVYELQVIIMTDLSELITGVKKRKKNCQKELYKRYAPVMRSICIRYTRDYDEAEDILQEGFIKLFTKINQYEGKGSFEGWMKRVFINTSINYIKKKRNILFHYDINDFPNEGIVHNFYDDQNFQSPDSEIVDDDFTEEEIMAIISKLPDGYKLVFSLYAIDQMSHKEISEMLNISVSTSKSQLFRARKTIQKQLSELSKAKQEHQKKLESIRQKGTNLRRIV